LSNESQEIISGRKCRRLWSPVPDCIWNTCNSRTVNRSCEKISLEVDCCGYSFYRAL